MATHNYDHNQPVTFGDQGGIIAINPHYDDILMVADHGKGSVIIYNITSGTYSFSDLLQSNNYWLVMFIMIYNMTSGMLSLPYNMQNYKQFV